LLVRQLNDLLNEVSAPNRVFQLAWPLGCSSDSLLESNKTISSGLKAAFERADNLPDEQKVTVIDLIDNYSISNSMKQMMDGDRQFFRMKGEMEYAKNDIE